MNHVPNICCNSIAPAIYEMCVFIDLLIAKQVTDRGDKSIDVNMYLLFKNLTLLRNCTFVNSLLINISVR